MKRLTYIIIGVAAAASLGFVAGALATTWYSEHLAKSDDDINSMVMVFLFIWPLVAALGGYVGHVLHEKTPTLPSSGPPPA
jgi:tryptophan-rich sensory protein